MEGVKIKKIFVRIPDLTTSTGPPPGLIMIPKFPMSKRGVKQVCGNVHSEAVDRLTAVRNGA